MLIFIKSVDNRHTSSMFMNNSSVRTPKRQPTLAHQVEEILMERIHEGNYPPNTQIPSESELAIELNVSRATVRSALSTLATLGLVVRRHGSGTFVTELPRLANPLDKTIDFQDLIASSRALPGVTLIYLALEEVSPGMAEALQMKTGEKALVAHKIFLADDDPMIFCINTMPAQMFDQALLKTVFDDPDMLEPIYDFFEEQFGQRVEHHIAKVRASLAKNCWFRDGLPFNPNTPILVIDEVAYTAEGRPLFHTYEYHPENKMSFELIRRRIQRSTNL